MFPKDIARKPFFVRTGQDVRDVRMYVRTDKGDAICPPIINGGGIKTTCILDCLSNNFFIILYYFKKEKRKYNFF